MRKSGETASQRIRTSQSEYVSHKQGEGSPKLLWYFSKEVSIEWLLSAFIPDQKSSE